jgi:hypothetical protein
MTIKLTISEIDILLSIIHHEKEQYNYYNEKVLQNKRYQKYYEILTNLDKKFSNSLTI